MEQQEGGSMELTATQRENIDKVHAASTLNEIASGLLKRDSDRVFGRLIAALALTPGDAPYIEATFGCSQYSGGDAIVRFDGLAEATLVTYRAPTSAVSNAQSADIVVRRLDQVSTWRVETYSTIEELHTGLDRQLNDTRILVKFLDWSTYELSDSATRGDQRVGHLIAALACRLASR
jgi:hypothetical protein